MVNNTKPNCPIRELLQIRIRTPDLNLKTNLKNMKPGCHSEWGNRKRMGDKDGGKLGEGKKISVIPTL